MEKNKPNSFKQLVINRMLGMEAEQTQSPYRPYYHWVTAILCFNLRKYECVVGGVPLRIRKRASEARSQPGVPSPAGVWSQRLGENKPNSGNALFIKEMRENAEERTHRSHPAFYQWVTAISGFNFGKYECAVRRVPSRIRKRASEATYHPNSWAGAALRYKRPSTGRVGDAMFEPSEPNSVNALVIKDMRADARERTHRDHPPCYQWVTAILSLIFEENGWMVARPIKDSEARIQGKILPKEPGLGKRTYDLRFDVVRLEASTRRRVVGDNPSGTSTADFGRIRRAGGKLKLS
jgi:hypothetical protein